jgi:uncharacterized protein YhfF
VAAVLSGAKTTTTGLLIDHEVEGDPLPEAGERFALLDSAGKPVAVIEMLEVRVLPLGEIDLQHAVDEGEGHATVAAWRADHEDFWHSPAFRAAVNDPDFAVTDATLAVAQRFYLVSRYVRPSFLD